MINISLIQQPGQQISIRLDSDFYIIRIKSAINIMACDIIKNNIIIQTGMRIVAGTPLMPNPNPPSQLQIANFVFITNDNEYPDYTKFNTTQFLIYASAPEVNAIVAEKEKIYWDFING